MSTTINRKKSFIAALGALALALGAILLALSATVAHAAPDDGPGSNDPSNVPPGQTSQILPPMMLASENPVVFHGLQTTQWITTTWTPYMAGPVRCIWLEDGVKTGPGAIVYPPNPGVEPATLVGEIHYGKTYKTHLETLPENGPVLVGPTLTITTVRVDVTTANPHPPEITTPTITPTLIPRLPTLAPGGNRR